MYHYPAKLVRVIDGDTVILDIDIGFNLTHKITCRLYGINAPELSTSEGIQSKAKLTELLMKQNLGLNLWIKTIKDKTEKYGRYLVMLFKDESPSNEFPQSINNEMVAMGFAKEYML